MKTSGLFTTHGFTIPAKSGKPIRIIFFGDVHRDAPSHALDKWREDLKYWKSLKDVYFFGMGDYCIPMRGEILTRRGFISVDELKTGEEVLAYEAETNTTTWTPLRGIYLSPQQNLTSLKSKSFSVQCTAKHAWYARDHYKRIVRVETDKLKTNHKIIIAAPCHDSGANQISAADAAMLGWIVTDGHCRKSDPCAVSIAQSARNCLEEIKTLFAGMITGIYPAKNNDCATVNISRKSARALFERTGFDGKKSLPNIAARLPEDARKSMMSAMLNAEGWKERGHWRFAQKEGPVLEAFEILATLSGFRIGKRTKAKNGVVSVRLVSQERQFVGVADLRISSVSGKHDAWCPMTDHRSFVMRLDGQISITGNTDSTSTSERECLGNISERMHETFRNDIKALQLAKVEMIAKELAFMRGRIIGMLNGNHYFQFESGINSDQKLCELLSAKYLGVCSFVRLTFDNCGRRITRDIFAHHGQGAARLVGGSINRVAQMFEGVECDIVAMGHDHKRAAVPGTPRLFLSTCGGGELKLRSRSTTVIRSGSYLKSYEPGKANYNVDSQRPTCDLGHVELIVTLRDGDKIDPQIEIKTVC